MGELPSPPFKIELTLTRLARELLKKETFSKNFFSWCIMLLLLPINSIPFSNSAPAI